MLSYWSTWSRYWQIQVLAAKLITIRYHRILLQGLPKKLYHYIPQKGLGSSKGLKFLWLLGWSPNSRLLWFKYGDYHLGCLLSENSINMMTAVCPNLPRSYIPPFFFWGGGSWKSTPMLLMMMEAENETHVWTSWWWEVEGNHALLPWWPDETAR